MNKKTLLIDGQIFQTAAWHRGMGKYSLHFIRTLLSRRTQIYDKACIIFSEHLKIDTHVKKELHKQFQDITFISLDLKVPKNIPTEDITPIQSYNQRILEEYIDENTKGGGVDFLAPALFIEQMCAVFPQNARAILIFYDLIPLQYFDMYGELWSYKAYLARYSVLFRADIVLAISEQVARDLTYYTGINPGKVFTINGAQIPRDNNRSHRPRDFKYSKYILMPTGNDLRKNNHRATEAFEKFRQDKKNNAVNYKLVVTSTFDEKTKEELSRLSEAVLFVGNVLEEELLWLFKHADALLFVPEYEGLGLPVLEAVEAGIPIVCSDLSIFTEEMSADAFYVVDQYDSESISLGIKRAVDRDNFGKKQSVYGRISRSYTWEHTVELASIPINMESAAPIADKPRLAIFTPTPDGYSAIGRTVMLMHATLSRYFTIDYYVESGRSDSYQARTPLRANFLPYVASVFDSKAFNAKKYGEYAGVVYHIGNSEYHVETIKNALHLPGYAIFHDCMLEGVFSNELVRFGHMDRERFNAESSLHDPLIEQYKTTYTTSLLANQLGAVVHSDYAKSALESVNIMKTPITTQRLPVGIQAVIKDSPPNISDKKLRVGFAGVIHESKGLLVIKKLLQSSVKDKIEIVIFGASLSDDTLLEDLRQLDPVKVYENITDHKFSQLLSSIDIVMSYRSEYHGESSMTVLEALSHGAVPIVRAIGWFDELPNEVVCKVRDESEAVSVIERFVDRPEMILEYSNAGIKYVTQHNSYVAYADQLRKYMRSLESRQERGTVVNYVAENLRLNSSKEEISKLLD